MDSGIWYGVAAYVSWGLFPIYFKLTGHVAALEVLSHRIIWSFLALALVTVAGGRTNATFRASPRTYALYGAAATLIGVNWYVYVWAVASGFIVETSLGYFVTPFVNVLLGVIVFGERLRRGQWAAVVLAAAGVLFLAVTYGSLPWISLVLAISFGSYGLVKKKVAGSPVQGLTLETGVLFLPAVVYAVALERTDTASFLHAGVATDALLVGAGLITIAPLLFFAAAVQRVPLSIVGILQYIAPTMSFLLGVLVYREAFSPVQLVGFGFVWAALAVFTADGFMARRVSRMVALAHGTPESPR